ncbi:MAG: hypothetical protein DSY50_01645 [Desulfobulbus sp.]|nr:MAG: hypothetical protein DSY50_01645 [Desulfobulbus sp.]
MAHDEIKNKQKGGDRRVALLALAVNRNRTESSSGCLTSEEIATLADRTCSVSERQRYHNHLADCDSCYQQWLELEKTTNSRESKAASKKEGKLIRGRHFAWAGSFLAAAASVVLFLNLTQKVPLPERKVRIKSMVNEKSKPLASSPVDMITSPSEPTVPRKQVISREDSENSAIPPINLQNADVIENEFSKMDTYTKSGAILSADKKIRSKAKQEEVISPVISADSRSANNQSPVNIWIMNVREGCRSRKTSESYWEKQYLEGQKLSNFASESEEQVVLEVMALVDILRNSPAKNEKMCLKIFNRLNQRTSQ